MYHRLTALLHTADADKLVIATVAPSVRVTIAEAIGLPDGNELRNMAGPLVAALRQLGFDYVFDTQLSADLTIMEEGSELLHRCKHACYLLLQCLAAVLRRQMTCLITLQLLARAACEC